VQVDTKVSIPDQRQTSLIYETLSHRLTSYCLDLASALSGCSAFWPGSLIPSARASPTASFFRVPLTHLPLLWRSTTLRSDALVDGHGRVTVHAQLIDRLREAGAKVIALDVNFPEPSDTAADTALATSLKAAGNVVLPVELDFVVRGNTLVFDSKNTVQPIALIQAESKAAGFSNIPLDTDGVARRSSNAVSRSRWLSSRTFCL
jgi:hypothetical protein